VLKKLIQEIIKKIAYLFFKLIFKLEIEGREKIPINGPLVVVANHHSYLDPPLLIVSVPREVSFVAKKELFSTPIINLFVKFFDSIEVDRENPKLSTFKIILKKLSEGRAIGIFPEGKRVLNPQNFGKAEKGISWIISKYKAPILITYIDGTYQWYKKFKIKIIFRELIDLEKLEKILQEVKSEDFPDFLMRKVYDNL